MKLNKFGFRRDNIQADEWSTEVDARSDEDQLLYLEILWTEYKNVYASNNYSALQFFEEYLQIKYSHI